MTTGQRRIDTTKAGPRVYPLHGKNEPPPTPASCVGIWMLLGQSEILRQSLRAIKGKSLLPTC